MTNISIKQMQQEAFETALKRGQYDKPETTKALLMRVVQELAEAAEEIQHGKKTTEIYYDIPDNCNPEKGGMDAFVPENEKPQGFPTELADAVIAIASICGLYAIDLEQAIKMKMYYNKQRKD